MKGSQVSEMLSRRGDAVLTGPLPPNLITVKLFHNHRLPELKGQTPCADAPWHDLALCFCLHTARDGELTLVLGLDSFKFSEL